jgi:hypothetical protein
MMSEESRPGYTLWQAMSAAVNLSIRAIEEVRALTRQPGPQGEPGKYGATGKLPIVRPWSEKIYYEGNVVTHNGAAYQAVQDTGKEPGTSDDWTCIAARGDNGKDALGFKVCGTYSAEKAYSKHDVVAFNSGSFVALKDGAGTCPGPDWQLFSGPGKRGDKGERGEGVQGKQGSPGPTIVEWVREGYSAIPMMSDGTAGPALNVREFFELYHGEAR